ncbi:MAG: hypothetical protein UHK54_07510 [Acutalibacteraceae bacterium]|nr:hypothetical protein [Acutalibacteraceae bacterium]
MSAIVYFFSYLLSLILALPGIVISGGESKNDYSFTVETSQLGDVVPNTLSNINIWDMQGTNLFTNPRLNEKYNIMEFVEYIQLMQCTGGNAERDLFVDPTNYDVLDDYDFSPLIENCKGILTLGAKPHLKLGSVPMKYSQNAIKGANFDTNLYPPDDYDVYYNYMAAMAKALVDEFGAEEVLTWRFGVMTEFENSDWFMAPDGDPQKTAEAYCKLYDYTIAALQQEIGEDVFVGAHAMAVTEGLWDEKIFIEHCVSGTNYKTGEKGTRICFLSASFYDNRPGEYTKGYTLPETIAHLQQLAKDAGLEDLIFGVDEGRVLWGLNSGADDDQLLTRMVGDTYQAAYDARLNKQLIDQGGDYFSAWGYLSGGLYDGYPTVSYHVASRLATFAGSKRVAANPVKKGVIYGAEVEALSAFDGETLRIMAYNFKNDIDYNKTADLSFDVDASVFNSDKVNVTVYTVDDSCNYFDEWRQDREKYGIGDDCFGWSPDDPQIESTVTLKDPAARELYIKEQLAEKYEQCAQLKPVTYTADVVDGRVVLESSLAANGVVFFEVTAAN